ncbi:hypothetical protein PG985_006100 [Apiospora marii]|uniref:Uncharacterized protein n=1 Tax=Apiospora marii TaxID=335849 RepID=A0ABR1S6N7_9PEZI
MHVRKPLLPSLFIVFFIFAPLRPKLAAFYSSLLRPEGQRDGRIGIILFSEAWLEAVPALLKQAKRLWSTLGYEDLGLWGSREVFAVGIACPS